MPRTLPTASEKKGQLVEERGLVDSTGGGVHNLALSKKKQKSRTDKKYEKKETQPCIEARTMMETPNFMR